MSWPPGAEDGGHAGHFNGLGLAPTTICLSCAGKSNVTFACLSVDTELYDRGRLKKIPNWRWVGVRRVRIQYFDDYLNI